MGRRRIRCAFRGCVNKSYGHLGLCHAHYGQKRLGKKLHSFTPRKRTVHKYYDWQTCKFKGCDRKPKLHGWCPTHWAQIYKFHIKPRKIRFKGKYDTDICKIPLCGKKRYNRGYCEKHYRRVIRWGDPFIVGNIKGKNNPRWNGGISEYPNHYEMKKIRKEKIVKTGSKCEICGKKKWKRNLQIHHLDEKSDHLRTKLLCTKCHTKIHRKDFGRHGDGLCSAINDVCKLTNLSVYTIRNSFDYGSTAWKKHYQIVRLYC